MARPNQSRDHQGQGCIERRHTKRYVVQLLHFLFQRSRLVTATDQIDRTIAHRFPACIDVSLIAQRWIHFVVGVKGPQILIIETRFITRNARGNLNSASLAASQQFDRPSRRDAAQVQAATVVSSIRRSRAVARSSASAGSGGQPQDQLRQAFMHDSALRQAEALRVDRRWDDQTSNNTRALV